jgi:hypothetical protein
VMVASRLTGSRKKSCGSGWPSLLRLRRSWSIVQNSRNSSN